jgi:hypothetical protein
VVNEQPEPKEAVLTGPYAKSELRFALEPWEIRLVVLE